MKKSLNSSKITLLKAKTSDRVKPVKFNIHKHSFYLIKLMQNEPGDFSKSNNSLKNLYRSLIRRINNNRAMIYTLENIKTGVVYGFIIADSCYPCVVSIKIFMDESYKDTEHLKSALVYLFNKLFRHNVSQILIKTEKNNQKMQKILEATGFIYLGIYKDSMAYTLLKPGRKG